MRFENNTADGLLKDVCEFAAGLMATGSMVEVDSRSGKVYSFPEPVELVLSDPGNNILVNPLRGWNPLLAHIEALWLFLGRNDMELPGHYVKNLYTFSDDGQYMRAGYGTRLRHYNGTIFDYKVGEDWSKSNAQGYHQRDQLKLCYDKLKADSSTRQAVINIGDPMKDEEKQTKDYPCTRTIQYQKLPVRGLDSIVHMRSNDLIWGTFGVNISNFTRLQKLMSMALGMPMGKYYHYVTNLHIYERHLKMVAAIAEGNDIGVQPASEVYRDPGEHSWEHITTMMRMLEELEKRLRKTNSDNGLLDEIVEMDSSLYFADWAMVIMSWYHELRHAKLIQWWSLSQVVEKFMTMRSIQNG